MLINDKEYLNLRNEAFECIRNAQYSAVLSMNHALIVRNLNIGNLIISKSVWGNKFIDNLAKDIKMEFPRMTGFSVRNLKYMKRFALEFQEDDIEEYGLAGITWYHHIALMDKTVDKEQYIWYVQKTIENGWTRDVLVHQIEYNLYGRQVVTKIQNFSRVLPDIQSELAIQTMKDPYIFDFFQMKEDMVELDIEKNSLITFLNSC